MDVDEETAGVLTVNFDVPNCSCGVPVGCMLCCITGALFFKCKNKTCVYLEKSNQCAEIGDMDIGQWCKMGKSEVEEKIGEQNFRVLSEMRGKNMYIES